MLRLLQGTSATIMIETAILFCITLWLSIVAKWLGKANKENLL